MLKIKSNILIILACLGIAIGCDNTLDSLDEEKGIFSIYGDLNINQQVNYIRIKDLNVPLAKDTTQKFKGEVTLTNVKKGITERLKDTTITYGEVVTHNFRTTTDIKPDTRYRLIVEDTGGKKVTAITTTPAVASVKIKPKTGNCDSTFKIIFEPVKSAETIRLFTKFEFLETSFGIAHGSIPTTYIEEKNRFIFLFTPQIFLNEALQLLSAQGVVITCKKLTSDGFTFKYTHAGPNTITGPLSNSIRLPGGLGTFVGLYRDSFFLEIPRRMEK